MHRNVRQLRRLIKDLHALHVAETRMLRRLCGMTRMDKIRDEHKRRNLKVAPVTEKLQGNRLS